MSNIDSYNNQYIPNNSNNPNNPNNYNTEQSIQNRLIDEENEYYEFKKKIMSDNTIDNHMKSIMLQSKREYIDNLKQNDPNKCILTESHELNEFFKILEIKSKTSIEYLNHKNYLIQKIKNFNNNKIKTILLEFEMCWDVYCLINDEIKNKNNKTKLFEIFKPADPNEYANYVKIISISKKEYDKQELEKKQKLERKRLKKEANEKKNKELEEKNKNEKNKRANIISVILNQLNKLSNYDDEIKQLQIDLIQIFSNYLNLDTDHVIMDSNTNSRFCKFIDSVRISPDDKNNIKNICKC